jgi:hypothetical protein
MAALNWNGSWYMRTGGRNPCETLGIVFELSVVMIENGRPADYCCTSALSLLCTAWRGALM